MKIIIECLSCIYSNRNRGGMPDYEMKEYEFTLFSDAMRHWHNTGHDMEIKLDEVEDEE